MRGCFEARERRRCRIVHVHNRKRSIRLREDRTEFPRKIQDAPTQSTQIRLYLYCVLQYSIRSFGETRC